MSLSALELETCRRVLAETEAEFGAKAIARLAEVVRASAEGPMQYADPMQRPSKFYFPDIRAKPWWEVEEIEDAIILERSAGAFREELQQLLEGRMGFQHFDEGPDGFEAQDTNYGWNAFYFRWACRDVARNEALCPRSSAVLHQLPNLAQSAIFSALTAGTHLWPHCGPINGIVTIQLALLVPAGCEIRVGRETRTWQEGRCLVFDDSFEHEVWNRGQEGRFILLLDVWHPDVTAAERWFLERALRAIEDASEQAGAVSAIDKHRGALDGKEWWR
jgi:aspartyl/asparaginyl beta-hydroxylase (cupin superfamily)